MHETMVAQSLLAAISQEVAKYEQKPVAAKISCGQLYAINDEALQAAFAVATQGTPCEGMTHEIEHKPLNARCKTCDKNIEIQLSAPNCPACGTEDFEILPDEPLLLESIEFEE